MRDQHINLFQFENDPYFLSKLATLEACSCDMPLIFQGAESATRRLMSQWLGDEVGHGPRSICNSVAGIALLAAAGVGIGFLPLDYHADLIADESLQKLETTPKAPRLPFTIAYQSRANTESLQMLSNYAVRASTFILSK